MYIFDRYKIISYTTNLSQVITDLKKRILKLYAWSSQHIQ